MSSLIRSSIEGLKPKFQKMEINLDRLLSLMKDEDSQEILERLLAILETPEYKKVEQVLALLPEEIWARYKAFHVTGLAEQRLLKGAVKNVKKIYNQEIANPYINPALLAQFRLRPESGGTTGNSE